MDIFGKTGRDAVAARFWAKVEKGPNCWLWRGAVNKSSQHSHLGYGVMEITGRRVLAHRLSFALEHGEERLLPNLHVCHACDNRLCVRPDHLWQGTAGENADDCTRKGRRARGGRLPNAKLSPEAVRKIRAIATTNRGIGWCMMEFDISASAIADVMARRTWAHVV